MFVIETVNPGGTNDRPNHIEPLQLRPGVLLRRGTVGLSLRTGCERRRHGAELRLRCELPVRGGLHLRTGSQLRGCLSILPISPGLVSTRLRHAGER
jgi:hypothetical protein